MTKLPLFAMTPEDVPKLFQRSLDDLGLDYIDLYLVHSPLGVQKNEDGDFIKFDKDGKVRRRIVSRVREDHQSRYWRRLFEQVKFNPKTDLAGVWSSMERLVDSGRCRAIGASNFNSEQLERVSSGARRPIAVNQVECNASFQQKKLRATMARLGIQLMAYAPLGSPGKWSK